jgi:hypothetical protein
MEKTKMEIKFVKPQSTQNSEREKLMKGLAIKVRTEYEEWRDQTRRLSKRQIFDSAHTAVLFDNIVYVVENKSERLGVNELLVLLSFKNTLAEIQSEWLSGNSTLISDLSKTITKLATHNYGEMEVAA